MTRVCQPPGIDLLKGLNSEEQFQGYGFRVKELPVDPKTYRFKG